MHGHHSQLSTLWMHRQPLAKQERALTAWLNSHLSTAFGTEHSALKLDIVDGTAAAPSHDALPEAVQRLSAQVHGILWRQYKHNQGIYETMSKMYHKIDTGLFNLAEVGGGAG